MRKIMLLTVWVCLVGIGWGSLVAAEMPIRNVTATASSELTSHSRLAAWASDGVVDENGNLVSLGGVWESSGIGFETEEPDDFSPEVTFDLKAEMRVSRIRIWNFPEGLVAVKRVAVLASSDGTTFREVTMLEGISQVTSIGTPFEASGLIIDGRYIKFRILENWGGTIYPVTPGQNPGGFVGFAGLYEVGFHGEAGSAKTPPLISRSPERQAVSVGGSASFNAEASGNPVPSLQWEMAASAEGPWTELSAGAGVTGATSLTLGLANIQLEWNDRLMRLRASNSEGTNYSDAAMLKVYAPLPDFTTHPGDASARIGSEARLRVTMPASPGSTIAWLHEGGVVEGATLAELQIPWVKTTDAGKYRVRVANEVETRFSNEGTLTVLPWLQLRESFDGEARSPLWEPQDEIIGGGVLNPGGLKVDYVVLVPDMAGGEDSALRSINEEISIPGGRDFEIELHVVNSSGPGSGESALGGISVSTRDGSKSVMLELNAEFRDGSVKREVVGAMDEGDGPAQGTADARSPEIAGEFAALRMVYQSQTRRVSMYYRTETANSGPWQLLASYGLSGATGSHGGDNWNLADDTELKVSVGGYSEGAVVSPGQIQLNNFVIRSGIAPAITQDPEGVSVLSGGMATFEVAAEGSGPLSFQWRRNGTNLIESATVTGTSTARLTLASVVAEQAGTIEVVVSNLYGEAVSETATLEVQTPPSGIRRGLLAYYPFNGDTKDHSGNGRDGVINGGEVSATNDRNETAQGAMRLVNGHILVQGIDPDDYSTGFSIGAWFKPEEGLPSIVNWGVDGAPSSSILYDIGQGNMRFWLGPANIGGMGSVVEDERTRFGTWHHILITHGAEMDRVYLNGELVKEGQTHPIAGNENLMCIGRSQFHFTATIDDLMVFGRELSAAEVRTIKASGLIEAEPVKVSGVIATATSELTTHNRVAAHSVDGIYCDSNFWETAGVGFGATDDRDPAITFDMGAVKPLAHFMIWNSHELDPAIKRMVIEYSQDGVSFVRLREQALDPANGCPPVPQTVALGINARYVRFDFLENWNGVIFPVVGPNTGWAFIAIDEIEFYTGGTTPPEDVPLELADLRVIERFPAVLQVNVPGAGALTYQWHKDGAPLADGAGIQGSRSNLLKIVKATMGDAGLYQLKAVDGDTHYSSRIAELRVRKMPAPEARTNLTVVHVFGDEFGHYNTNIGSPRLEASLSIGSGLLEGTDGYLYGTTRGGGEKDQGGVLYRIKPNGADFTVLHHYGEGEFANRANIMEASDGKLYGSCWLGGELGFGYVYRIAKDGSGFQVLHHFGTIPNDGARPASTLVETADGDLYGATQYGGVPPEWDRQFAQGTIYRLRKDGSDYEMLTSFGPSESELRQPGEMMLASDGAFYGQTSSGNIFKYTVPEGYKSIAKPFGSRFAHGPLSGLVESPDGYFYGTAANMGTLYRIKPDGTDFSQPVGFGFLTYLPTAPVMQGRDGIFYSASGGSGSKGGGSPLALVPGQGYFPLHDFDPASEPGAFPTTKLTEGSDAGLYGVTGIVDKTAENGGHGMIYKLSWGLEFIIRLAQPARISGEEWDIGFSTEETGEHILWHATEVTGPWSEVDREFVRASQHVFKRSAAGASNGFFRVSRK